MQKHLIKSKIKRNFSRSALTYDDHASVQKACAGQLIKQLEGTSCRKILEVGCGTGTYTRLLRKRYPDAEITAVDISEGMVGEAEKKWCVDTGHHRTTFYRLKVKAVAK